MTRALSDAERCLILRSVLSRIYAMIEYAEWGRDLGGDDIDQIQKYIEEAQAEDDEIQKAQQAEADADADRKEREPEPWGGPPDPSNRGRK